LTAYLSFEQLLLLHRVQIERYGGSPGVRDAGALDAAAARPAASFGGDDLYPDLASKAAALMHSVVMNHPFVDGNKRVGAQAVLVFLGANGHGLSATPADVVHVTLSVARGEMGVEPLTIWLRQRMTPLEPR
jgi:death-on-curing protein